MLLRNPLGRRRRVGGADWGERRLFEQVRETLKRRTLPGLSTKRSGKRVAGRKK